MEDACFAYFYKLFQIFAPLYKKLFCPFAVAFFGIRKSESVFLRSWDAEWEFLVNKSIKYCGAEWFTDMDNTTANTIYRTMILPTYTYCGILQLKLSNTQISRLSSFHSRSLRIVYGDKTAGKGLMQVINAKKLRACKFVWKCLDKDTCDNFQNY